MQNDIFLLVTKYLAKARPMLYSTKQRADADVNN
jgi:hypothetical protein